MRRAIVGLAVLALLSTLPGVRAQGIDFQRSSVPTTGGTITATRGPELAPAIGAGTGYTCGAGWDCSVAGVLNKNADGVGTVAPTPAITAVVGTTYKIVITLGAVTVGNGATYTFGGTSGTAALTSATTYTHYVTASTTASLIITPTPTSTRFTITSVSVKAFTDGTGDLTVEGDLTVRSRLVIPTGTMSCSIPAIVGADPDSGFGFYSSVAQPAMCSNGTLAAYASGTAFVVQATLWVGSAQLSGAGSAQMQLGAANGAAPIAQTLTSQGCRGGTDSNCAGPGMTLGPIATAGSTGTAIPPPFTVNRGITTTTGATAQAVAPAMRVCGARILSNTSATAQTLATITTTSNSGGGVDIFYSVSANDGTIVDVDTGHITVSWDNNAGTATATASATYGVANRVTAPDTLAATPTATVATNVVSLKLTPTWTNTTPTTVLGYMTILVNGVDAPVCQ